jgi:hypothetical protein
MICVDLEGIRPLGVVLAVVGADLSYTALPRGDP